MTSPSFKFTVLTLSLALHFGVVMPSYAQSDSEPLEGARAQMVKARAEREAAKKAVADVPAGGEKEAAEKALREKSKALEQAEEAFRAQETFAADKAVKTGKAALAKAEKALAGAGNSDEKRRNLEREVAGARDTVARSLERAAQARAAVIGGLKPLAAGAWDYEKARHLLFRAGFGGPPEEVARLYRMGLFAAVDYLVDYHLRPQPAGWFDAFPHLRTEGYEKLLNASQRAELAQSRVTFRQDQHHRMRRAWLQRMVETERPLQEKLTLFWHGHFATSFLAGEDSYAMWQQNELFRRRASGNFGALLNGITHDPAMIRYLDNHENFKGSGNENLGREILELFSMGEGKGYTEKDLAEAARALTGYNFEYHNGQFKYLASRHDDTEKTIFGKKGNFGGDELVDLILRQPATARFISAKLFRFFAYDEPSEETIGKMSRVLRDGAYELQPMLRNLFQSEEFYSERSMGNHIKSPVELMVGAVRTLKLAKVDYGSMDTATTNLGQRLFEPPNVAGWEGGRAWVDASSLLLRYNLVSKLIESADLVAWFEKSEIADPAAAVDYLARAVLCVPLSGTRRQELINYLGQLPPKDQWAGKRGEVNARLRAVMVALVSLPEFQLADSARLPSNSELPALALR